jgi:OOP family OmpA-OmpF porin
MTHQSTQTGRRWLGLVALLWAVAAPAQTPSEVPDMAQPLGDVFKVPSLLSKSQSRVVFYRQEANPNLESDDAGMASVFVDGRYQASLQRGAFSEVCVPPKKVNLAAVMDRRLDHDNPPEAMDTESAFVLQAGADVFVRVTQQPNGRAELLAQPPERALPELVKLRAQQHTLTRVANAAPCLEDVERRQAGLAMPESATYAITLEADALFPFGRSNVQTLSSKGRRLLDHLADRIQTEFGNGNRVRIQVVGHADSFGGKDTNLKISTARAEAIKSYFVQGGLKADRIKAEGRGDQERLVVTCSTTLNAASVACNKPNRRVVVNVWGTLTPQVDN